MICWILATLGNSAIVGYASPMVTDAKTIMIDAPASNVRIDRIGKEP